MILPASVNKLRQTRKATATLTTGYGITQRLNMQRDRPLYTLLFGREVGLAVLSKAYRTRP